jgi:NADH-quinone oxidoreductase subunit L
MAIVAGWWNVTGSFSRFMGHEGGEAAGSAIGAIFSVFTHTTNGIPLPLISLVVALLGIFSAYAVYCARWITAESLGKFFGPLYNVVYQKYFFDKLYEDIIVKLVLIKNLFTGFQLFDSKGVDGAVNGVSDIVMSGGRAIRRVQTGQLQLYGLFIGIGIAIIAICVYIFG